MFNLKSWRWSQILYLSALKRVFTHINQIFFVLIFIGLAVCLLYRHVSPDIINSWSLWSICGILVAYSVLSTICTSDKYFEVKDDKKVYHKIYLYNNGIYSSNYQIHMIIISILDDGEYIMEYKIDNYDVWKNNKLSSFLFSHNDTYYYLSPVLSDPMELGQRRSKTIFVTGTNDSTSLIALDKDGRVNIQKGLFIFGRIFIPPKAKQNIQSATGKVKAPDNYIIIIKHYHYLIYGIYENEPAFTELKIPYVIFKDKGEDVVLQWVENTGYKEMYRTHHSIKRNLSNAFVELDYNRPNAPVVGKVSKLNETTNKIETLYHGPFYAIHFDSGEVIGENGYEYIPDPTKSYFHW